MSAQKLSDPAEELAESLTPLGLPVLNAAGLGRARGAAVAAVPPRLKRLLARAPSAT
jgi:hypothetical protein